MKLKKFHIKSNYSTYNYIRTKLRYKLFNGRVMIDLKGIIDKVLLEQGISISNVQKMNLSIPYDANNQMSGNAIAINIDKKKFLLRLKNFEVIPYKQQKIDCDNTHPHRWSVSQWLNLIENLFYESYGFAALDLDVRGNSGGVKRGRVFSNINQLKESILNLDAFKTDHDSIVEYLRWVFTEKSRRVSLTLPLICCKSMIQDWIVYKKRQIRKAPDENKKRKWD